VKLRKLLKRFRLRSVDLEGSDRQMDNVDATASGQSLLSGPSPVAPMAPPNWVPSQQDERPRH
jgi:hypothetical protein